AQEQAEAERTRLERAQREKHERMNAARRSAAPNAKRILRVHQVLFADIHWTDGRLTRTRGLAVEVEHFGRRSGYFADSRGQLLTEVAVFPAPVDDVIRGTVREMEVRLEMLTGRAGYSF